MSGLEEKLSGILSDPDAVSKLKSLGSALGLDVGSQNEAVTKPAAPSFGGIPLAKSSTNNDELMSTLMRIAPLLSDMNKDDEVSCLLNSLRPFLSEKRQSRLDEAGKMLRVMRLLPLIKSSGLL